MLNPRVLGTLVLAGYSTAAFADRFGIDESMNDGSASGSWWINGIMVGLYLYLYFMKR